ncbi:C-C motif chemokine 17-like [Cetorhinus maximus]
MKQVLVALICLSIFTLSLEADPVPRAKECCRKYSKRIPALTKIQHYKKMSQRCNMDAVLFKVNGKWICLNPKDKKVKELVKKFSQCLSE